MIRSKSDYKRFLLLETNTETSNFLLNYLKFWNKPNFKFLLYLRTCEYLKNCKPYGFLNSFVYFTVKYFKNKLGIVLSFSIPENVVDEGLQLPHYGTIVINGNARIGKNCRIHVCVNIGASGGSLKAPQIGDYVYIAPGAKIYGDITIANRIAIAANAAVSRSFLSADKLIGGVPAKEIGDINILDHIKINESI